MSIVGRRAHGIGGFRELVRENETLATLSAIMIVNMIGIGMVAPVLPLYGRTFGVSSAMVGMLITSFGLARLCTGLPAGRLADRIGRRPLLVTAPVITAVGAVLAAIAPTFWLLIVTRFIQGIGSALFATAAFSTLADISTPENRGRTMTVFEGCLLLGASIGPAVGGLAADLVGMRGIFYLYAVTSGFSALWALLRIKESAHPAQRVSSATESTGTGQAQNGNVVWALLTSPNFLAVSLVSFAIFFSRTGGRSTIVPLVADEKLAMSESSIGLLLTVAAVFNALALPFAGWGIDRFGRKHVIVPSMLVSALSLSLFALAPNPGLIFLAAALTGIGTGIAGPAPSAYVADLARGSSVGQTMGLFRTMGDFGFVVGPVLLGWIADHTDFDTALHVNGALLLVAGLVFALVARETRHMAVRAPGPASVPEPSRTTAPND